jgi:hypothetical protein
MSARPTPDIHAMIAELCWPRRHTEAYEVKLNGTTWNRRHPSQVPSLLRQLELATPSSRGADRSAGYASRPAAMLEALDTLVWIDLESSRWLRVDLHLDDPGNTAECISMLGGQYPGLDAEVQRTLEQDVRRWWTQARVVTGWDVAPFRPDNTCPGCSKRGTLRVRVFDAYDASGFCVECRTSWSPAAIGLLAEHIRTENHEEGEQASA